MKQRILLAMNNKYMLLPCLLICGLFTLINGYPILYSDTSTYLASGFELETPMDRPITYGLLLRLFSIEGLSLLFVPFFQSAILLYVLYQLLSLFVEKKRIPINLFCLSALTGVASGFYWSLNELLPDCFTAIGFLSLFIILVRERKPAKEIPMFTLYFVSAATHLSNVFIFLALLLIFFVIRKRMLPGLDRKNFNLKTGISAVLLVISFAIMGSAFSKSKHVFFVGSLAEKGILQKILNDNCVDHNLELCRYTDSIPPSFEFFVWNPESPLQKMGGWKASQEELKRIVSLCNTNFRYLGMQLNFTFRFFLDQLFMLDIGEGNGAFDENTLLIRRIKMYTVLDDRLSVSSLQSEAAFLELNTINLYYRITAGLTVIILVWLLASRRYFQDARIKVLVLLSVALIVLNSFLIAYSSQISHRIGCKLFWLLLLSCFLLVISRKKDPEQGS